MNVPIVTALPIPPSIRPHNIEAEQALMGAILINNDIVDKINNFLLPRHFYDPVHSRIFELTNKFINNGNLASPVTLKTYFENDEGLKELGGISYLSKLVSHATTIINATQYAQTIYDLSMRRELIDLGENIVNTARDSEIDQDPVTQIEIAEQALYTIAEKGHHKSGFLDFNDSLSGAIEIAERARQRDGKLSGIASGFKELDNVLGGLQESDLIILAGRPSMGKTALATNIAFNIAKDCIQTLNMNLIEKKGENNKPIVQAGAVVGFFSLEMSAEQIATRILSEQTEIFSNKIRKGDISDIEYDKIYNKSKELESLPLYIDHTGAIAIATLVARARRLKRQNNLGLIVIDYLQLIRVADKNRINNRVHEISIITQQLKALAKELEIPIIALSQLSRQVESREDKRPQLADLRESGSIEQDADIVMFIYREEYYKIREEPKEGTEEHLKWQEDMDHIHNVADLIISKNRHGPIKSIKLTFRPEFTRFKDLEDSDQL